ncbi:MAG: HPr family phosphocarrier protein [Pontixanthobacter sp.]
MSAEHRKTITIVNRRGLHARASAKFVGAAAALPDGVQAKIVKEPNEAAGGSILGLMMLGAAKGDTIELVVTGENSQAAFEELAALIENGFGEE